MASTTSADGTTIGYTRVGQGPAIVLVDGAMCYCGAGPMAPLATVLQNRFAVYTYDRRGRGESSDTLPYAVEREVEDLQAVIAAAGGRAALYAMSSGGSLALVSAAADRGVTRLALYEPPFVTEVEGGARLQHYTERLAELLDRGRSGDAVALFMTYVGMPPQVVAAVWTQPGWQALEAIAPTLRYDAQVLGDGAVPRDVAAAITVPTLVLSGGASPDGLQRTARATAAAIPGAVHRRLDSQTHDVRPAALAPVLSQFFAS